MHVNFIPSSSSFTPASIATLKAWYDSTDNATITQSSNLVSQWNDKSGNSINLTQSAGANKFTVSAAAINSLQALLAPDVPGEFANSGMLGNFGGTLSSFSVGLLLKPTGTIESFACFLGGGGGANEISLPVINSGDITKMNGYISGTGESTATATNAFVVGTVYWVFATYDGTTVKIYTNNTQVLSTTFSGAHMAAAFSVCGTVAAGYGTLNSYVGDVVVYSSVLSSTDRTNLYSQFISPKWGV